MGLTEILFDINPVEIGSIAVDAMLTEEHTSDADVTDHPVEQGADISDHIRKKPAQITLTGVISNTPLEFLSFDTSVTLDGRVVGRAEAAWQSLLDLQRDQKLVTVVTTLATYENMAMVSLRCPRDAQRGNSIEFTAVLREISTAVSETIPKPDTPRPPAVPLGNKATGAATAAKRQSLFSSVLSFFGV